MVSDVKSPETYGAGAELQKQYEMMKWWHASQHDVARFYAVGVTWLIQLNDPTTLAGVSTDTSLRLLF